MKDSHDKSEEVARSAEELIQMRMRTLSSIFERMNQQHMPPPSKNHLKFYFEKRNKSSNP